MFVKVLKINQYIPLQDIVVVWHYPHNTHFQVKCVSNEYFCIEECDLQKVISHLFPLDDHVHINPTHIIKIEYGQIYLRSTSLSVTTDYSNYDQATGNYKVKEIQIPDMQCFNGSTEDMVQRINQFIEQKRFDYTVDSVIYSNNLEGKT